MKKVFLLSLIGAVLSFSLWLARQLADSGATPETARLALQRGDYAEAQRAYESLANAPGPSQKEGRQGLMHCLLLTGQYEAVESLATRYLNASPESPEWRFFLGKALALRGKYTEAKSAFERAIHTQSVTAIDAQLQLARLLEASGELDKSRALFSAVQERAEAGGRLDLAAQALQHLERFKESNRLFKQATAQNSADFETWVAWGNLFLEKYNPAEAASVFADVLKLNPKHPEALLGLALSRGEGAGDEVEKLLATALSINPNLEAAHAAKAQFALLAESFDAAEREISLCFRINPNSLEAHTLKAVLHFAQGQDAAMQESIQAALRINPKYGEVFESLGHFCVTQRLYKESVEFFKRAIEINPRLWKAYAALGANLMRIGEEKSAKEILDRGFEHDPYNVWTFNTLKLIDSFANFEKSNTANFNVRLHQKEAKLLAHYVPDLLEEAFRSLSSKYQFTPETPIYFEMFPDHEDFAVRTMGVPGLGALGVCFGRGVVMDSPSARPKSSFNWGSTLWHEFAHVITLQATDHRVPRWFTEGLSVMEEHRARPGWGDRLNLDIVRAIQEKELLPIAELNRGFLRPKSPGQLQLSYFQAGQACDFIEKEFGFKAILKMLALFKAKASLSEALKQALNQTAASFDQRFNAYIDSQYARINAAVDFSVLENRELMQDPKKLAALLARHPDNFFANLKLASYHRKEGEQAKAVAYFNKAKEIFPGYVESDNPYKQLSEIHKEQGHLAEAAAELQALTAIHDSDFPSLKQLALWLKELNRPVEARQALERAMFVYPFDPESHQLSAELARSAGDHRIALREYRALLALDPSDKAGIHLSTSSVLLEMGRKAEAKKEALAALEIAPGFEPAQELLLKTLESGSRP